MKTPHRFFFLFIALLCPVLVRGDANPGVRDALGGMLVRAAEAMRAGVWRVDGRIDEVDWLEGSNDKGKFQDLGTVKGWIEGMNYDLVWHYIGNNPAPDERRVAVDGRLWQSWDGGKSWEEYHGKLSRTIEAYPWLGLPLPATGKKLAFMGEGEEMSGGGTWQAYRVGRCGGAGAEADGVFYPARWEEAAGVRAAGACAIRISDGGVPGKTDD